MSDGSASLLQLSLPWYQFVLRAVLVYFAVMVLVRISGKRAVGQFTPFDLVLLILIGNAVQNGLNGGDNSLSAAVILSATLLALNYGVAFVSARYPRIRKVVEGEPVILVHDGHVHRDVLKRELVSRADFDKAMREAGLSDVDEIHQAVLETNGHITIIPKPSPGQQKSGAH
ncbi:DUF421 domain-containing protein [Lysobacter yangpyeongensis]|uniref:DUF421 domain-containing protein n=1 Tax=Lysobacter yangpyeongensis TaxID=346182 RepID=A0ABW0SMS0_9GAMM